ncbi:MAG TPA: hypothetical protein VGE77_05785 [Nocardioides sp.]
MDWTPDTLRAALRTDLVAAMRERDRVAAGALRTMIAAIDNAEAVAVDADAPVGDGPIAGAAVGVGAAEAVRRDLTPDDLVALVTEQVDERRAAAAELAALDRPDDVARLHREADLLATYLP